MRILYDERDHKDEIVFNCPDCHCLWAEEKKECVEAILASNIAPTVFLRDYVGACPYCKKRFYSYKGPIKYGMRPDYDIDGLPRCGSCGVILYKRNNYCHKCGRRVKWDEVD